MPDIVNRVSNKAVKKATGKAWDEWFAVLEEEGAGGMTHKEIVRLLRDKGYIESGWWCQTVTVGYEMARGSRVVGETETAGFEIGVQGTLPISPRQAWEIITGPEGMRIWLGTVSEMQFVRGHTYQTADGTRGEIRSIKPGQRLRLTWQPTHWLRPSTLQISIIPGGNKTSIRFHQEKLAGETEREQMRSHWRQVIDRLRRVIENSE